MAADLDERRGVRVRHALGGHDGDAFHPLRRRDDDDCHEHSNGDCDGLRDHHERRDCLLMESITHVDTHTIELLDTHFVTCHHEQ